MYNNDKARDKATGDRYRAKDFMYLWGEQTQWKTDQHNKRRNDISEKGSTTLTRIIYDACKNHKSNNIPYVY